MDTARIAHPAHPSADQKRLTEELRCLEERLAHELMGDEDRQELRDRVLCLRRRHGHGWR